MNASSRAYVAVCVDGNLDYALYKFTLPEETKTNLDTLRPGSLIPNEIDWAAAWFQRVLEERLPGGPATVQCLRFEDYSNLKEITLGGGSVYLIDGKEIVL